MARKAKTQPTTSPAAGVEKILKKFDEFAVALTQAKTDIDTCRKVEIDRKQALDSAKADRLEAEHVLESTVDMIVRFVGGGSREILPLFDQLAAADESIHGHGAAEWREWSVAELRLSAEALARMVSNDIVLIGQLQDLILDRGDDWADGLEGISSAMADAITQKYHAFIDEQR